MTEARKTPNPQIVPSSNPFLADWGIDNSQPDRVYDEPPAYSVTPREDTTGSIEHQSHAPRENFVRLCPHQKLSFERFNRVANLPNIHHAKGLDALMKLPATHHVKRLDGERLCFTNPGAHYFVSPPAGQVSFRHKQNSHVGQAPGFELSATWALITTPGKSEVRPGRMERMSKPNIQRILSKSNVWLCPHLRLSDHWVVSAVFGVFRPGERYDDPIEQYRAEQGGGDEVLRCGGCKTEVKVSQRERSDGFEECHVMAVRFLGTGQEADDASWLEQCALTRNEVVEEEKVVEKKEEEKKKKKKKKGPANIALRRECCVM